MTVTFDPARKSSTITLSGGNLVATGTASGDHMVQGTDAGLAGYYYECTGATGVGVGNSSSGMDTYFNGASGGADSIGYYDSGQIFGIGDNVTVQTFTASDVIGVAIDAGGGRIRFYKNGISQFVSTFAPTGSIVPQCEVDGGYVATANFGATTLAHLPVGYTSWDGSQGGNIAADQTLGTLGQTAAGTVSGGARSAAVSQTLGTLGQAATAHGPGGIAAGVDQALGGLGQAATGMVTGTVGGGGSGTFTWNPADKDANIILSNGNLTATGAAGIYSDSCVRGIEARGPGYYFEVKFANDPLTRCCVGVANTTQPLDSYVGASFTGAGAYYAHGGSYGLGLNENTTPYTSADIIGVGITVLGVAFYKNGVLQDTSSYLPSGSFYPIVDLTAGVSVTANFGASPMVYLPSGFVAWNGTQSVSATAAVSQRLPNLGQAATVSPGALPDPTGTGGVVTGTTTNTLTPLQQQALNALNALNNPDRAMRGTAPQLTPAQIQTLATIGVYVNALGQAVGTTTATTGTTAPITPNAIVWPEDKIPLLATNFRRRTLSTSGGKSVTGVEQIRASSFDRWEGQINARIRSPQQAGAYRALLNKSDGRSGQWIVPVCGNNYSPSSNPYTAYSDGVLHSDGSGFVTSGNAVVSSVYVGNDANGNPEYAVVTSGTIGALQNTVATSAAAGARQISIRADRGSPEAGMYMSIGERLYVITDLHNTSGTTFLVTIRPGLREAVTSGAIVNLEHPICRMRLASDDTGELNLESFRFAPVTLNFVEDF